MKEFRFASLVLVVALPALAQAQVHDGRAVEEAAPQDPHAAHDTPVTPAADPPAHEVAADPHAAYTTPAMQPAQPVEPDQEVVADPVAGRDMSTGQSAETAADPHAGHVMPGSAAAPPLRDASPPPEAFSGPLYAADTIFDPDVMANSRALMRNTHGNFITYWIMADALEAAHNDGRDAYSWDVQGWYGGDVNKLWLKTEGEGDFNDETESIELQALWSRAIRPFFDLQAGIRHDLEPGPSRSHVVLGLQGLVPFEFEIDAAAFLSDHGDLTARVEFEYDVRVTQRLVLQPRVEMEFAAQDIPALGIASGARAGELGFRLRYELAREFAPYIGIKYERSFGDTADIARAAGEDTRGWNVIAGLRIWF